MKHEEEAPDELARLLQSALRAETPAGLSPAQRAALGEASRGVPAAGLGRVRAALVAMACLLPVGLYATVHQLRAREQAVANAKLQDEQQAELRAAQEAARFETESSHKALQESAKQRAQAEAAAAAAASFSAGGAHSAHESGDAGLRPAIVASKRRASRVRAAKAAKAAKASSASQKSASGACDPNDALCGL